MRLACLPLALTALTAPGSAQVLYQHSFDSAAGWNLSGMWNVDDSPTTAPNGSFRSPPFSLNYNNGVNYAGTSQGTKKATSGFIDLGQAVGIPVLSYWCNNQSEEGVCLTVHEAFKVIVSGQGGGTSLCMNVYQPYYNPITCVYTSWHEHVLALDRSWGVSRIEFTARHDSFYANDTEGWFIDDVEIRDYPAPITYCTAKTNTQGCTPAITYTGAPSATAWSNYNPYTVVATQVINNKDGIFFYGLNGQAAVPFQSGTLCSAPPRRRTPITSSAGNPPPNDCSGVFLFNFTGWMETGKDPALVPGVVVNGQFWYRDKGASFDTGLSDAIEFNVLP
jgi:hypothetical protein